MTRRLRPRFWDRIPLSEMTEEEWEALCDGCGKCCLNKLEDAETGEVAYTNVACRLLDIENCKCTDYANRAKIIADCIVLTADDPEPYERLPDSCAYRRLAEGRGLADWHPLVSGDAQSVQRARISVRGRVISETAVDIEDIEHRVIRWLKVPSSAPKRRA